jgi:hypothetical protein
MHVSYNESSSQVIFFDVCSSTLVRWPFGCQQVVCPYYKNIKDIHSNLVPLNKVSLP